MSSSIDVTGVQSDAVHNDVTVAGSGSDDHVDDPMSGTQANESEGGGSGSNNGFEKEFLEIEGHSMDMEVEFAGDSDLRDIPVISERLVDEGEGLVDDGGVEGVSSASGLLEKSVGETENISDAENSVEEQTLHDGDKLLPYAEKTVVNDALGSETKASMNKKESVRVCLDECGDKDGVNSKKKGNFCASDLVWGKVRSHPWWPGQVFEPGDASVKAKKHFRAKSYLVAYFGDHSFAWNDRAKLKPFVPHFSQMVKQSSMDAFRHAVGCALDEVSRRVEFGLSCDCIDADVYSGFKTQVIENDGVQEQQIVHENGDMSFAASTFKPVQLLDYVRSLALEPQTEFDKLEHVMAQGQVSAFYRWKGYYHLPKFEPLIGYVNNEADLLVTEQKEEIYKVVDHNKVAEGALEEHGSRLKKRKNMFGDDCRPAKKEKPLSDIMRKRKPYMNVGDENTKGKSDRESTLSSSNSKKASRSLLSGPNTEIHTPMASKDLKPSFRVGESILRVAGQLSKPSPLLKLDVSSHGKTKKAKGSSKQTLKHTKVGHAQHSSGEILSHLRLAAKEPLKDQSMPTSMVNFFSDFRNSVVQDDDTSQKHEGSRGTDIVGNSDERPNELEPAGMDQRCSPGSVLKEKASDSEITSDLAAEEDACCTKLPGDNKLQTFPTGSLNAKSEHSQFDEKMQQEASLTALTLKFTDIGSIPTEDKLCKIFSHFGPLKESETQILTKKNCARVVFKRRLDAETAFSSSGKFEIFGPSLVCYRLADAPSPRKSLSFEAKRRRKEKSHVEENEV